MGKAIADILQSKKALTAIVAAIVAAGAKIGWGVSTEALTLILAPLMAYIVAQGIADLGKELAKIESSNTAHKPNGNNVES